MRVPLHRLIPLLLLTMAAGVGVRAAELYFPGEDSEWERIDPADAGWDVAALEVALDYAGEQRSTGVVVLVEGRILAERYWQVPRNSASGIDRLALMTVGRSEDGRNIEDVASAQKSVISFLAGVAEGRGILDLEAPASMYLGEGWSKATLEQERKIRVRHLLSMASGLAEDGTYGHPAGEFWMYNTAAYSKMIDVLEKISGMDLNDYTAEWLTAPIGMTESRWERRGWVAESAWTNAYGFATSARDLARFGLLVLAGGSWDGEDILGNPTYLERALKPSQSMNTSYGYLWWLNGGDKIVSGREVMRTRPGPLIPSAPNDLVAAQGALQRKCYVAPSLNLVVTRLGDEPPGQNFNEQFWRRLMKAIP